MTTTKDKTNEENTILKVKNLQTVFYTEKGIVKAVDDVSFNLEQGKTLGIVGESGCGKSVTALSLMRLIMPPAGKIRQGEILLRGENGFENLLQISTEEMRHIRGRDISMIFQEPMTSLNPVYKVGDQVAEVFTLHHGASKKEAWEKSIDMLQKVGIPSPEKRVHDYPHSLSGGMRQRVMIAMALACRPKILICDEPTTALDVTIQAQILDLMRKLQEEEKMSIIFISHDLGVIADLCDEVMVMYSGKTVEFCETKPLYHNPSHPYTEALLSSIPRLGQSPDEKLNTIPGLVPNLLDLPKGCHFADRCSYVKDSCKQTLPELKSLGKQEKEAQGFENLSESRWVRCFFPVKGETSMPKNR